VSPSEFVETISELYAKSKRDLANLELALDRELQTIHGLQAQVEALQQERDEYKEYKARLEAALRHERAQERLLDLQGQLLECANKMLEARTAAWERVQQVLEDECDCEAHPDELEPEDLCLGHRIEAAWKGNP
jgi:chromosome segregation ATPase